MAAGVVASAASAGSAPPIKTSNMTAQVSDDTILLNVVTILPAPICVFQPDYQTCRRERT
jgi:hypothetical protein